MTMNRTSAIQLLMAGVIIFSSCKKNSNGSSAPPKDPNTAERAMIDRFSPAAGHLQVRTTANGLPGPNQPVNFDAGVFITTGLTPAGQPVDYYNFDVQPTTPAPIWTFVKNGQPVTGQLNIINVIPGEANYNDFWQVYKVNVPEDYVANTITSFDELANSGYNIERTNDLVNCPVVPEGSTATKRLNNGDAGLTKGWYKGKLVFYFNFFEKPLSVNANGQVPVIPIYVTFNINPDQPGGGPASGFKTESTTSLQTHNVLSAIPSNGGYSPLWTVKVYDNAAFNNVTNYAAASAATLLDPNAGAVNCPVVKLQ